jgi:hypothetical protein
MQIKFLHRRYLSLRIYPDTENSPPADRKDRAGTRFRPD